MRRPRRRGVFADFETKGPGGLLFGLDDVSPYCLVCFVALGRKVRPAFRLVESNCVIEAVPFDDSHVLGSRRSIYLNDTSGRGAQCSAMGRLYRLSNLGKVCGLG
jgi:hypothetical protein